LRRHRLYETEIPAVIEGLSLLMAREGQGQPHEIEPDAWVTEGFKALFRVKTYPTTRPVYPDPMTWGAILAFINVSPASRDYLAAMEEAIPV